jgi:tRNA threonylcarbamoyladenosine biosynthesis protein TsaE
MRREELFSGFSAETRSEEETFALGQALAGCLRKGDKLLLYGEPGAGKTALARGICLGLGYGDYVTSPTFAIVNEYPARIPVYHFDLYRIAPDDLYDIGAEEYLNGEGICIVEWPDGAEDILGEPSIRIGIEKMGEGSRRIGTLCGEGEAC